MNKQVTGHSNTDKRAVNKNTVTDVLCGRGDKTESNLKGWQPALLTDEDPVLYTDEDPVLQAGARDVSSRPPVEACQGVRLSQCRPNTDWNSYRYSTV